MDGISENQSFIKSDSKLNTVKSAAQKLSREIPLFFWKPAEAKPLAALRIGLSILLIIQAFVLRNWIFDFLASDGLVQAPLSQDLWTANIPNIPNISWLTQWISPSFLTEEKAILLICSLYAGSLFLLGLGLFTRVSSILTWLLHWSITNTAFSTHYGFDIYAHIFLFYLMLVPCGDCWSLDAWRRIQPAPPKATNRLALRVLQIHLCLSYLGSGLLKAQGEQWWNGELLWKSLNLPIYYQFDMTWLGHWPILLVLGGWLTLALEIGYCVFIWPRSSRWPWIWGILALHLGIVVFLGLHFFGFLMCLLTLSLFGISPEPERIFVRGKYFGNSPPLPAGLILFDGICNLCNGWVRFVKARDPNKRFNFAPLYSKEAAAALEGSGFSPEDVSTIFLVANNQVYQQSDAVLMICRNLTAPWPLLYGLIVIPRSLRNRLYRLVANNRYRWFGKTD
ncbi:MAG: DCC1-like thiol-disulfide oxidoreductase family protein, partial [Proteobacteria bacterium]|nr:DCC1-like thiol-disulfide oxidoreductase family protein [Pseudomonadota bacterium]